MDISFSWTTPAMVLEEKTETRRAWSKRHLATVRGVRDRQAEVRFLDRRREWGGKEIGFGRVVRLELELPESAVPESAWEAEGFHVLSALGCKVDGLTCAELWLQKAEAEQWIVGLKLLGLTDHGRERARKWHATLDAAGGPWSLERALAEHELARGAKQGRRKGAAVPSDRVLEGFEL